jgi:Amt family ammonium transporter
MKKIILAAISLFGLSCLPALAQGTKPVLDSGSTAWMIVASALVLLMTIPGLALFYGGLVRRKNVLSVFMQCFIITAVVSIEWVVIGYSMAFGTSEGFLKPFVGGLNYVFLNGLGINSLEATGIPSLIFVMFQGMFAVITPALIIGAFAERINFKGFLLFTILWAIFIYNPLAHWVWNADGWLFKMGALDFAGGTVVHINAGISALVTAIMLGKRRDYKGHALPPHNIPFVAMGAALLWIGWFGFNAGSGLAANGLAANAFLVTHIATATAALVWAVLDWFVGKKPTVVGISTGAVAGLVAITPAAGSVDLTGAFAIGIAVALICFFMVAFVKEKLGYDDSLDAFGVHGIGGIVGAILTGVFATSAVTGGAHGALFGDWHQLGVQAIAVGASIAFAGIGTAILFFISDKLVGVRATDKQEAIGLDETQHGETAYTTFD